MKINNYLHIMIYMIFVTIFSCGSNDETELSVKEKEKLQYQKTGGYPATLYMQYTSNCLTEKKCFQAGKITFVDTQILHFLNTDDDVVNNATYFWSEEKLIIDLQYWEKLIIFKYVEKNNTFISDDEDIYELTADLTSRYKKE